MSLSRHTLTSAKCTAPPCANKSGNPIIGFLLVIWPIAPISKISFSKPSQGLKETLVVNRPDPGHPWKPQHWLSHSLLPLQTKFQVYGASPWPIRDPDLVLVLTNIFFHSRRGGTCPEPIPIVYIFPVPAPSEELAVLPDRNRHPPHPTPPEPPTVVAKYVDLAYFLCQKMVLSS